LKRTPYKYQDAVLWAWLEMSFTPKRYQFSNNTLSPVIFFSAQFNALEGIAKAPTVDLFEVKHPKRYENQFLTPKWYDEHTSPFCMGPRSAFPREDYGKVVSMRRFAKKIKIQYLVPQMLVSGLLNES